MSRSQTVKHPSVKSMAQSGLSWNLTNATDTDLVVINLNDSQADRQLYEQPLQLLKTTDGQSFIQTGKTGAVSLNNVFTDGDGYSQILFARADNLFPVKTANLKPDANSGVYPPLTVSADDVKNMKLAEKFKKLITSFPSCTLAQDYANAIADTDDGTKADAFFQATQDYKQLTLDMVVAIDTYYEAFPFVWADYASEKTYYLYASDGTANQHMGAVTLTNECSIPMSADKTVPGFTVTYGNNNAYKPLTYLDGQFVDDTKSSAPAICLQGLFMLKSQLTSIDTDNVVVSVLSGTVNGQDVLGYQYENEFMVQEVQSVASTDDNQSDLANLFHPDDMMGYVKMVSTILGGLAGLVLAGYVIKKVRDRFRNSEPVEKSRTAAEYRTRMEGIYQKTGINKQLPDNLGQSWRRIKDETREVILKKNKNALEDILTKQGEYCSQILQLGDSTKLREIEGQISDMNDDLLATRAIDLPGIMDKFMNDLTTNTRGLNDSASAARRKASLKEREALDTSKESIDQATSRVEASERTRAELEKDEYPEEIRIEE